MKIFRSISPALVLILLAGCASTPPASEASVQVAMAGFMEALNALDTDRIASYFDDDVTAFVPRAQGERVDGKVALVKIFANYVKVTRATTSRTNLVPEDQRIDLYGDTAVVSFHLRSPDAVGRRTFVFRRRAGQWRIVHFHASSFAVGA
jgi:ketosteroid isomerase-like protein